VNDGAPGGGGGGGGGGLKDRWMRGGCSSCIMCLYCAGVGQQTWFSNLLLQCTCSKQQQQQTTAWCCGYGCAAC
jgi:hypothetical protein